MKHSTKSKVSKHSADHKGKAMNLNYLLAFLGAITVIGWIVYYVWINPY